MRKNVLLMAVLATMATSLYASSNTGIKANGDAKAVKAVKAKHVIGQNVAISGREATTENTPLPANQISYEKSGVAGEEVGFTTYDLQTNNSLCDRIFVDAEGTAHMAWTYSNAFSLAAEDRGTGYNTVTADGTIAEFSEARIEAGRTGWPNIGQVTEGPNAGRIVVVSHFASAAASFGGLSFAWKEDAMSDWQTESFETGFGIVDEAATWPRMAISGQTIHIIAGRQGADGDEACGLLGGLAYYRSTDGGDTFEDAGCITGLTAENFTNLTGDGYAIDADGDNVAIVTGIFGTTLFKSTDGGDSWEMNRVVEMDDYLFAGELGQTLPNELVTGDECYEVLLDANGTAHIWFGRNVISDDDEAEGWSVFPANTALQYWNENMTTGPVAIGETVRFDTDGDSIAPFDFNTSESNAYFGSLVSHPSAGIDAAGNIYVAYSAIVDGAIDANNNFYRDVFLIKSLDGGQSWEGPYNVTNDPTEEAMYASVAKNVVDGVVHLVYQSDEQVGMAVQGPGGDGMHAFALNSIRYVQVAVDDIERYEGALNTVPDFLILSAFFGFEGCEEYGPDQVNHFTLDFPDGELEVELSGPYMDNIGVPGDYDLVVSATDSDGNEESTIFEALTVNPDQAAPVIIAEPLFIDEEGFIFSNFDLYDTVEVVQGEPYNDLGAQIFENEQVFVPEACSSVLNTINPLASSTDVELGFYEVVYSGVDINGKEAEDVIRVVNVIAADLTPPEIILFADEAQEFILGEDDTLFVEFLPAGDFVDPGFLAFDNVDGPLDADVTVEGVVNLNALGTYTITYTVTDSHGNTTTVDRIVVVQDTQAPIITLAGPNPLVLAEQNGTFECGQEFVDPGLLGANDLADTEFSIEDVTISGCIYTGCAQAGVPNIDTLYYTGCDASGNCLTVARTVIINVANPCEINCHPDAIEFCDVSLGVGIEELSADQIGLYPNPSTGQFTIEMDVINEAAVINVYDMAGALVKTLNTTKGTQTVKVDLGNITTGVYFVSITSATKTVAKKVMIEK